MTTDFFQGHGSDAPATVALSDHELVQRIAASDKSAMHIFFERHHDSLIAFLRARGADVSEASDALQEAMLDVWRTAGKFRGHSSPKTWVFTIARNKLIDGHRKTSKLSFVDEIPETEDTEPNAEAIVAAASDAKRLRACLDGLKPAHQNVMRMAFFDDLSYEEISVIEEVPSGTVKTRVFHAKQLLLRCLGHR